MKGIFLCQRIPDRNHGARVLHIIGIECNFSFMYRIDSILIALSIIRKDEEAEIEN